MALKAYIMAYNSPKVAQWFEMWHTTQNTQVLEAPKSA
jgi:hypothetical protein